MDLQTYKLRYNRLYADAFNSNCVRSFVRCLKAEDITDMKSLSNIFADMRNDYLQFSELHESEQQKVMSNEYTRIIFVRNPFVRLLAIHSMLFERPSDDPLDNRNELGIEVIKAIRSNPSNYSLTFGSDVQFAEFAQYCLVRGLQKHKYLELLWMPIYKVCNPCAMNYTMIGKWDYLN